MKKTMMVLALLSVGLLGTAAADLRDGLAAYWPLDGQIVGNSVPDMSGNGRDGVLVGSATTTTGILGEGLLFNGNGGNGVNCGTWNPAETTGKMTVSIWANWNGAPGSWQGIIGKRDNWRDSGRQVEYCWFAEIAAGAGTVSWQSTDNSLSLGTMPIGVWTHVAVSWDGVNATTWRDGVAVATGPFTLGDKLDATIWLAACNAGPNNNFHGIIDEAAIWDRALSPAEIAELYNGGNGVALSGNTWRPVPVSPANKASDIPMAGVMLEWDAPAEAPPLPIIRYDVYLGTEKKEVADPNGGTASGAFLVSVDPAAVLEAATGELFNNKTYYWKVVAVAGDANTAAGPIWSFDTVVMTPTIVTQPRDVGVGPGGWDAALTIAATSPADGPTYAWYKDGGGLVGTEPTLTIYGVNDAKAGGYYCIVSNSYGATVSDMVYVSILKYEPGGGLRSGLWGYYPLDGNADDKSGNNHHGTLVGSAPYVNGIVGQAIKFNGSSYINLNRWNPSESTGKLSFAMWLTWDGGGGDWQGPIGKRDAWAANQMMWILEANKPAVYGEMQFMQEQSYPGLTYVMPDDQTPVHVAVSFDGAIARMYINGEPTSTGGGFTFGSDTEAALVIGSTQGNGGNAWSGMIDEVGIWNRPLTADEVRQLYAGGAGTALPSEAWWQPVAPNPDGTVVIDPEVDLALSWQYGPYPPKTAGYAVYFGMGTAARDVLSDPNSDASAYYKGTVPAGQPLAFVISAADMDYNSKCWWRVDTVDGGSRVAGVAWSFDTVRTLPEILIQPAGALVDEGETAALSIEVTTGTCEWFKEGGGSVGTGNPLEIPGIDESKEGNYYSVVSNSAGSVTSDPCKIMLKQMVAHWTMDDVIDAGNNQVLDSTKFARHGTASGNVTSVPGLIGGALHFSTGWVDCGTFNQSDPGGQMTIAFWANWNGSHGSWQSALAKRDEWGENTMMWAITNHAQNGNRVQLESPASYPWFGGDDFYAVGEWTHIIFTFDGVNALMYVNGFHAGGPSPFAFSSGTNAHIYLGAAQNPGYDPFNGTLDDVRIFNYALDPVSAVKLYTEVTGHTGCPYPLAYDLSGDCEVNLADFAIIASNWMECGLIPETACE
ncbi:MAG: hypothetical protein IH624_07770 [Phycisphaerae bacterium]|nr:hypothetical protein [Phycisphaerae bacterium]